MRKGPAPARVVCTARKRLRRLRLQPGARAQRALYSVHLERADGNPARPDFIPPGYGPSDVTFHNVSRNGARTVPPPTRSRARGTSAGASRIVQFSSDRIGAVELNPTARPGSEDNGLRYTSGSDLGFSNGGGPNALPHQRS